jgi:hypothetical protein
MRQIIALSAALVLSPFFVGPAATPIARAQGNPPAKIRVGVFDSRIVALAYYNADEHQRAMRQMMTDLRDARAADNQERVRELEFQGPALQNLQHYQVFSTASVPNVVEQLGEVLPKVASDAGVSVIVSKWEVAYARSDVEYVDVTDALVRPFNPNARVQQWIAQGRVQKPMPLLEAVKTLRADR